MTANDRDRFRAVIGETLGVDPKRVALFARGRVALYAILRAIGIVPGDEVVVPAFTCVAVPNAILYAGARPVWVDIDPATLCLDPDAVASALTNRTKAIVAQNTFGLSSDLDAIGDLAAKGKVPVVDDCTHGMGGRYQGRSNGLTTPFAFFSTQWSKPISTGLGGIALDRDDALDGQLRRLEDEAVEPSMARVAVLRALIYGRDVAGSGRVLRSGRAVYRQLSRAGLLPASSSDDELGGTTMPPGFLARLSHAQARLGSERLARLAADVERRRSVAHRYSAFLAEHGRSAAIEPADQQHAFLRYPLRVTDRGRFRAAAQQAGIDIGDWFVSPVHPVTNNLERWGYVAGQAPQAEQACREIVNLPTDPTLSDGQVDSVIALLERHMELIR